MYKNYKLQIFVELIRHRPLFFHTRVITRVTSSSQRNIHCDESKTLHQGNNLTSLTEFQHFIRECFIQYSRVSHIKLRFYLFSDSRYYKWNQLYLLYNGQIEWQKQKSYVWTSKKVWYYYLLYVFSAFQCLFDLAHLANSTNIGAMLLRTHSTQGGMKFIETKSPVILCFCVQSMSPHPKYNKMRKMHALQNYL